MIGMALFVDNLERIHYGIPVVIEHWRSLADHIFLFTGSPPSTSILKRDITEDKQLSIIELGVRINYPQDIPVATDTSIRWCYEHGVDTLAFCYADMYITPRCIELMREMIERHEAANIIFEHVQLYQRMWAVFGGLTLQYKENPIYCTHGTGHFAVIKGTEPENCVLVRDETLLLDVGYLTVAQYRNKMYSHNFIWPDPYKVKVGRAFDANIDTGLKMAYKMIQSYKKGGVLAPIDPELYGHLFDVYNVWSEYHHCVDVMRQV